MDQTNCPSGWATDRVMFLGNDPFACDMPVAGWVVLNVFFILAKLFVAIHHSLTWVRRARNTKGQPSRRTNHTRLPIVPFLSWLLFLTFFLFMILTCSNVANVQNGGSPFLLGFGWLIFSIMSLLFLSKFVGLGHRIAPRMRNNATGSMVGAEKLARFDTKGKISLVLCLFAMTAQTVLLCVVPFFYTVDDRFIRAAIGIEAYFLFQFSISIFNHFERVKALVQKSRDLNLANVSPEITRELNVVIKRIAQQEIVVMTLIAMAVTVHLMVTAQVFAFHWFIVLVFIYLETANLVLLALTNMRRKGKASSNTPKVTDTSSNPVNGGKNDNTTWNQDNNNVTSKPGTQITSYTPASELNQDE